VLGLAGGVAGDQHGQRWARHDPVPRQRMKRPP
jgi:hypothetical protein